MDVNDLFSAFIPIFVTVDAFGTLPIYAALVDGLDQKQKTHVIDQSVLTALLMSIGFIAVGKIIFKFLGIQMGDFMVAGGVILFCVSINDIMSPTKRRRHVPSMDVGVVPIGTPLIAGPAVLTTSLIVLDQYGVAATVIAVMLNIILAGLILKNAERMIRIFGLNGARALSKVMALFLAAIAVMMIRKGVLSILP
jgi:multiple antibiotic resistance protein